MAKLIDLGEEEVEPAAEGGGGKQSTTTTQSLPATNGEHDETMSNPNVGLFSAALVCYPVVSQLASNLDLNSLHELSRTCRQFRASLLQYRDQLVEHTMRCENEHVNPAIRLGAALHASHQAWTTYGRDGGKIGRITSGKVGSCARDMVGDCRRCGRVVCRNCTMKAPQSVLLKGRHRRLCRTCMKSPLDHLTTTTTTTTNLERSISIDEPVEKTYLRTPCTCPTNLWICQPCGQTLAPSDRTYTAGFSWRKSYSQIGGLGAGLGEGNEGVECGRNADFRCLAARDVVQEIECDSADADAEIEAAMGGIGLGGGEGNGRTWVGSSYTTAEIVGIGGSLKRKVRKRVPVGAVVKEYEDERASGKYLIREQSGVNRSWCSWCARVVPGKKDAERDGGSAESVELSSSDSSFSS